MKGLNEVRLIGNVGSEPAIQFTLAGHKIARFSLATDEEWRDTASGDLRKKNRVALCRGTEEDCRRGGEVLHTG